MPTYSELSLLLAVTTLSWQTPLKYGYEFPASKNIQTSKLKAEDTKTQVAASCETSVCVSYITSYPRIMLCRNSLPCEPQTSECKISLFIATKSLEQNPSEATKSLSKNSTTSIELDVSLSTSQQPTIWPHPIVLFKLQFNVT
jgi:hypothetical protein